VRSVAGDKRDVAMEVTQVMQVMAVMKDGQLLASIIYFTVITYITISDTPLPAS
jgi:hypothetical protein